MQTEKEVECCAFIQVFRPQDSIVFLPQDHHDHHHHISIVFFPPPPPPHFYSFPSTTTTTFLLFSSTTTTFLLPSSITTTITFPLFYSTTVNIRLQTTMISSVCRNVSSFQEQSWFSSTLSCLSSSLATVPLTESQFTTTTCISSSLIQYT